LKAIPKKYISLGYYLAAKFTSLSMIKQFKVTINSKFSPSEVQTSQPNMPYFQRKPNFLMAATKPTIYFDGYMKKAEMYCANKTE
jgi:hypothetical protein